jgi:hypothetical protein
MALTYSYDSISATYSVISNSCTAGAVVIPSTYNDGVNGVRSVTGINDGAFAGCTSITSIVIPNSVTYLGEGVFNDCPNLSSVSIGTGVTGFTLNLFRDCISLINLTVPSNILIISPESFYGCSNLTNINIDSNNPNYTSVDGVVFNKNITTLVLYPIGKIGSYSIPNTVTTIAFESFLNCTNLTNITIPNSVTNIQTYSLVGCTGLISLIIPNSVTSIGDYAFLDCTNINSVTISNNLTSINTGIFQRCSALTIVTIPNIVTSIGQQAFFDCTNLTRVTIPNSVTSINLGAFSTCPNLKNITIPKNVTTIGNQAFANCTSLTRVNFLGNAPSLGTDIFLNTNVNLKVYRYSTKSGWSSTFGGEDVLLIDSPATGLETFGFGSNSSGQVSVKKTNIGNGKLSLSKFDPKNISNIALWTKQGSLNYVDNQSVIYLSLFPGAYSGGDIDTDYYPDDNLFISYTGVDFGFKIVYSESQGLWYLLDLDGNEIAQTENLVAGGWYTYPGLDDLELNTYDVDAFTSTGDTIKWTWSDVSGKNNHLTSRPFPRNNGINSAIIGNYFSPSNGPSNLETKALNTPLKTTNVIDLLNPFTIYMVLWDGYTGTGTRRILGISGTALGITYSNLYLESTASGSFDHTFSLKYYNSQTGITQTAFSVNLNKSVFASSTYQHGSSILKLSSNYTTTSGSFSRTMTLTYYNLLKNTTITTTPNIGSAFGTGNIIVGPYSVSSFPSLYISSDSYGQTLASTFLLSEVLIYNKSLNNQEDGSIIRYLERKYYGKLLP